MTERRARRKPGENRERLTEAGLTEFGLLGYHGAATARIAARAGVPQPHVYANFTTKQELFLACVAVAAERIALGHGSAADELLVFQAVAAAPTAELSASVRPVLEALWEGLGEPARSELLDRAATQLLRS